MNISGKKESASKRRRYGQSNDLKRHINKCHQEDNRPKKSIPMPPLATNIGGGPMELAPNLPS